MARLLRRLALVGLVAGCSGGDGDGVTRIPIGGDGGAVDDGPCTETLTRCNGDVHERCTGGAWVPTGSLECSLEICMGDGCGDPCAAAAVERSYIGCEYWPVDLDNAVEVLQPPEDGRCRSGVVRDDLPVCTDGTENRGECDYGGACPDGFECRVSVACTLDAQRSPFAIVVSNPSDSETAEIRLQSGDGAERGATVGPGEVKALFPQGAELGLADQSINHSGVSRKAYRLTSSIPIVAYQFNPLDNVDVFSNDGSLLIPEHAYDTIYLALTLPSLERRPSTNDYDGYVTIVASAPGTTRLQITPSAAVRAGDGVEALVAGQDYQFELEQFEVLNLEGAPGGDLTGTRIGSLDAKTFGVFVGHEATLLPASREAPCCADHVEEQLFPVSTWGERFAIARSQPRALGEPDILRILATRNGTTVTFDPAPLQGQCGAIASGETCDVFIGQDTVVTASEPVLVAHILMSAGAPGVVPEGDPAMAFAVPSEQFRKAYTFLVPEQYDNQYISVVAVAGAPVVLDGRDIAGDLRPFGGQAFVGGRIPVQPGQRNLTCEATCGVLVHGYSTAVSYLFAAGLDLKQITAP